MKCSMKTQSSKLLVSCSQGITSGCTVKVGDFTHHICGNHFRPFGGMSMAERTFLDYEHFEDKTGMRLDPERRTRTTPRDTKGVVEEHRQLRLAELTAASEARQHLNKEKEEDMFLIGFTGHRPNKLGGYNPNPMRAWVKTQMLNHVSFLFSDTEPEAVDPKVGIVWGGALGVDQWAAMLANHLGLPHVLIQPFKGFYSKWPKSSQDEFKALANTTDPYLADYVMEKYSGEFNLVKAVNDKGIILVHDTAEYNPKFMMDRNMVMVDVSDEMVAVYDGSEKGGTANCVGYIRHTDTPVTIINPNDYDNS